MPYKDPQKQKEYQNKWMADRRFDFFKDKFCVKCGSTENLQLDHIERDKKVSHRIWSWSEKRRLEELAKCQVLCEKCHKNKTAQECKELFSIELVHGTKSGYSKGCRCPDCHQGLLAWWREYRQNKKHNPE